MDPAATAAALGPRARALLPVHLYGRVADMSALASLARSHALETLEDAAQAHGAMRDGAGAGTTGRGGAFSFYPAKNLGAMGDAGALVTNDAAIADTVRSLREHGQRHKYRHDEIGWTSRLDTLHAAVLLRKLPFLDEWNAQRRAAADLYAEGLAGVGDLTLPDVADRGQVWHLFVVRTADRDGLAAHLGAANIGTGRHYPEPPHLSAAYSFLGHPEGSFPVAERLARECLSLPIFPGITQSQVEQVVAEVRAWFGDG
jgi:dTDP-4-amino-4,6-dideoxygalactose transaminase